MTLPGTWGRASVLAGNGDGPGREEQHGLRARLPPPSAHLDDTFCGKDVGLDLGQVHEAQVEGAVGLGPRDLQLLHSPTQHSLDPVVVALQLSSLDLVQQRWGRDCSAGGPSEQPARGCPSGTPKAVGHRAPIRNPAARVSGHDPGGRL